MPGVVTAGPEVGAPVSSGCTRESATGHRDLSPVTLLSYRPAGPAHDCLRRSARILPRFSQARPGHRHRFGEPMYETILTEERDGVGTVTLNRPERLNAWTPRMGAEVRHAITAFDTRDDIRVIVVTGAGRAFCAGADISDEAQSDRSGGASLVEREVPYWRMNTPIIAAMNGAAVGVGITLAMQFDFRVMAEDAKYGFVFNRRGLLPELGSTWIVPRLVGLAKAMDLLLTARIFTGAEAAEIGLANAAVPAESVLDRAVELARDIAVNVAPASAALTKRLLSAFLVESDREKAEALEHDLFAWTLAQDDAKEGIAAFFEKRAPQWKHSKHQLPEDLLGDLG